MTVEVDLAILQTVSTALQGLAIEQKLGDVFSLGAIRELGNPHEIDQHINIIGNGIMLEARGTSVKLPEIVAMVPGLTEQSAKHLVKHLEKQGRVQVNGLSGRVTFR